MNLKSGYPFWLIKNGLPFEYPRLDKSVKTDVVIIGGGISGALMGYYLAKAGIPFIIVDGRTIGLGSTCASTSLLQYEIDTPLSKLAQLIGVGDSIRAYRLCADAIDHLAKIASNVNFAEFNYRPSLYYAAYKKDLSQLKDEFTIRKRAGFEVAWLEEKKIDDQYGFKTAGGILSAKAADTNAYAFTHALHQYSIKKGMQVYDRTKISKINSGKKIVLKTENGCTITCMKIIYATGYEAIDQIDKKIVDLKSTYACISQQFTESFAFWKDRALLWNTADPYLYLRTTNDQRIIIGGRDEDFYNPSKRDKLLAVKTRSLKNDFEKMFPKLSFLPEYSWTGTFGSTKDGLPFIGNYLKKKNSYFALGFRGNGITFSQIAAKIITDLITGRKNEDASLFSFSRI